MPDKEFDDSVVTADKWSRMIALFVAIGAFLLALELTDDLQFSSVVAAVAGIGSRMYIPYHASLRVPEDDRLPIHEHPMTGNYNHGAAGLALLVTSVVSLGVFLFGHGFVTAVGVGIGSGVISYFVLRSLLPTA